MEVTDGGLSDGLNNKRHARYLASFSHRSHWVLLAPKFAAMRHLPSKISCKTTSVCTAMLYAVCCDTCHQRV